MHDFKVLFLDNLKKPYICLKFPPKILIILRKHAKIKKNKKSDLVGPDQFSNNSGPVFGNSIFKSFRLVMVVAPRLPQQAAGDADLQPLNLQGIGRGDSPARESKIAKYVK